MTALVNEMRRHIGSARLVGTFVVESPEWYAARQAGITGSEIAAVLGISPFESPFSLWHRKAQLIGPTEPNDVMEWGKRLEDAVRAKYLENHDRAYERHLGATWSHRDRPWQIANPDAILDSPYSDGPWLWEGKTARRDDEWGEPGTDEIPVYYRAQVLWYLDTLSLPFAHVSVLIAGSDYREYHVTHDEAECEFMRTEARKFLDSIEAGRRPSVDTHSQTYIVARKLHPEIDEETVEIPPTVAARFVAAAKSYKRAEARRSRANADLAMRMGRAKYAACDDRRIASRVPGRGDAAPYVKATSQKETSK